MRAIANLTFEAGEKKEGMFEVPGTGFKLPATIISGKKPGKTVLLTAGVHSCEYVGIQVLQEMRRELSPDDIAGTLVIIPVVNRTGFENRTPTIVPEDGKNLNRVFPGKANGFASEKLAWFMTSQLFSEIDFYVDLHCGGIFEDLDRYVYFVGACDEKVSAYARGAAEYCNVPYMVKSFSKTGCYNWAGCMGVPSLLLERGGRGRWSHEEVREDKADVVNILKYVGMMDGEPQKPENTPFLLEAPQYLEIEKSGFWYTDLKAGDRFNCGDELGYVTDYDGHVIERVVAEHDGQVLYLTKTLWASKYTEVICCAKLCNGSECHEHDHHHEHPGFEHIGTHH